MTKRDKVSGAVKFKHKSRTNPSLTGKDKLMRAYQDLESKMTGKPNARGAENLRQLRAFTDTIEDLLGQQNKMDTDMMSIKLN